MTSKLKFLVASSAIAVAMLGANPAFAAGTASGTDITNNVSVAYQVGGVAQTAKVASDTFKVDRKINLTVAEVGTTTTSVSPGQTNAVTAFTVTNNSNATLDFGLSAAQIVGGTAQHGGTDNFDLTNLKVFLDVNNNGVYDVATDTATYIDELAADGTRTVFIIGDIPAAQVNGNVAGVVLTAIAKESGASATEGAVVTQTSGANTAGEDTVFADVAGATDSARDGRHSAGDDYTVLAANLTATKTSKILWDPLNKLIDPKAIPGAVVEYCILLSNSGPAAATNVNVTDALANVSGSNTDKVVFLASNSATAADASVTNFSPALATPFVMSGGASCTAVGAINGSYTAGTLTVTSGNIPTIASGGAASVIFRVTVQ